MMEHPPAERGGDQRGDGQQFAERKAEPSAAPVSMPQQHGRGSGDYQREQQQIDQQTPPGKVKQVDTLKGIERFEEAPGPAMRFDWWTASIDDGERPYLFDFVVTARHFQRRQQNLAVDQD